MLSSSVGSLHLTISPNSLREVLCGSSWKGPHEGILEQAPFGDSIPLFAQFTYPWSIYHIVKQHPGRHQRPREHMSQYKRSIRASADSDHICLTVSGGTFSHCLAGFFYMDIAIFDYCYLCSNTSVSGISIQASKYILIFVSAQAVGLNMCGSE